MGVNIPNKGNNDQVSCVFILPGWPPVKPGFLMKG